MGLFKNLIVSTHSRLQAAGGIFWGSISVVLGFNTQPPEGGWDEDFIRAASMLSEVSTHSRLKAAGSPQNLMYDGYNVSTHSRLKAAGRLWLLVLHMVWCFNTQPPEGGWIPSKAAPNVIIVSTHSRLKAAGSKPLNNQQTYNPRFNTQPPEGGWWRSSVNSWI